MQPSARSTTSISGSRLGALVAAGILCGAGALTAPLATAHAEDAESARLRSFREQYERAGRAYNSKDYAAAIPALQSAFAIQPAPQLLFNIAQAYRRLDQFGSARVYFELYRSMSGELKPEVAETVGQYIKEMEEREKAARTPQIVEKTRLVVVQAEKPPPRWLRPFGITAGLAGLASLSVGAAFLGLDGSCRTPAQAPALECEQVYSTKTLGTTLAAVGAGVLVLGAVTFGLSLKKPSRPAVREEAQLPIDTLPLLPPSQLRVPQGAGAPEREPPPAGFGESGTRQRAQAP